jgi:hypothetical protein
MVVTERIPGYPTVSTTIEAVHPSAVLYCRDMIGVGGEQSRQAVALSFVVDGPA